MTSIWLSPRLPVDRSALAEALGPGTEISSAELPPAGTSVAVATVFERPLLERLANVPGAGALLLLKPPGTATPLDLPLAAGRSSVVEAADVSEVANAVRGELAGASAPWPASEPFVQTPSGWLVQPRSDTPTGEMPTVNDRVGPAGVGAAGAAAAGTAAAGAAAAGEGAAARPGRSFRRNWLASGGIVGAAALAAVVVLATQGGATGTQNAGFRGGAGGIGGYGFGGLDGGAPGAPGSRNDSDTAGTAPGTGTNPGNGSASNAGPGTNGSSSTDRAAQRQAFLDCLQTNGVDTSSLAQGQRPRLDPSDPTMASALDACRSLLPRPGFRDGDGTPPRGSGRGMPGGTGAPGMPEGETSSGSGSSGTGSATSRTTAGRST